jgi:hypothetical protein
MRAIPNVVLYNPVAANGNIRDFTGNIDLSLCSVNNITNNGFYTLGSTTTNAFNPGDLLGVHWSADSRLGIV